VRGKKPLESLKSDFVNAAPDFGPGLEDQLGLTCTWEPVLGLPGNQLH